MAEVEVIRKAASNQRSRPSPPLAKSALWCVSGQQPAISVMWPALAPAPGRCLPVMSVPEPHANAELPTCWSVPEPHTDVAFPHLPVPEPHKDMKLPRW